MVEVGLGLERRPRRASPNPLSPQHDYGRTTAVANPGRESELGGNACDNPQSRAVPTVEMSTSMGGSSTHTQREHTAASWPSRSSHVPSSRVSHFLAPIALVTIPTAVIVVVATSAQVAATRSESVDSRQTAVRKLPPYWTVRAGDTFTEISRRTGLTLAELQMFNPNADRQALAPGQRLNLWAHPPSPASEAAGTVLLDGEAGRVVWLDRRQYGDRPGVARAAEPCDQAQARCSPERE